MKLGTETSTHNLKLASFIHFSRINPLLSKINVHCSIQCWSKSVPPCSFSKFYTWNPRISYHCIGHFPFQQVTNFGKRFNTWHFCLCSKNVILSYRRKLKVWNTFSKCIRNPVASTQTSEINRSFAWVKNAEIRPFKMNIHQITSLGLLCRCFS